jgi:predicted MFS family arabinose efflux permease
LLSMPFMLGMYVTSLHFELARAGLLVSIELCTLSIVCMAVSPWVDRASKRQLALIGALIAIAGNGLSLLGHSFAMLALYRTLTAVGYGLAMASGNAAVTSAGDPARLYDNKMMVFAATQLLIVTLVPLVLVHAGPQGFFLFMVLLNVLMVPLVLRLPHARKEVSASRLVLPRTKLQVPAMIAASLVLFAVAAYALRESLCWAFVERLGVGVKVDAQLVGMLVGVGTLPGILMPRVATLLRARFGAIGPGVLGVVVGGGILYAISATDSRTTFLVLLLVWPAAYFFSVPLLMGIAARIDSEGRVIAAAAGALQIAFAAGPAVAGFLVERSGPDALSQVILVATGAMVIVILCCAVSITRLSQHELRQAQAQRA